MHVFEIREEPIELYKLLKIAGLAESGGEAKAVVSKGLVRLNGVVETQKRKKVMAGDVIDLGVEKMKVLLKQRNRKSST